MSKYPIFIYISVHIQMYFDIKYILLFLPYTVSLILVKIRIGRKTSYKVIFMLLKHIWSLKSYTFQEYPSYFQ